MFGILVAAILGPYLLGDQGGNDSVGNPLVTFVFWTVIAAEVTRAFP